MKTGPILITSFQPWRAHQRSNSSHDLLESLSRSHQLPEGTVWLPAVPVNFELAPIRVISEINRLRPSLVICCGMAEQRQRLSIERQAVERRAISRQAIPVNKAACLQTGLQNSAHAAEALQTSIDVSRLLDNTLLSEISDDAGSYVCNHLYHCVLKCVAQAGWPVKGLFIHVPSLTIENKVLILNDFVNIVLQLAVQNL